MTEIITMPERLYLIAESRFNLPTINSQSEPSPFNSQTRIGGPSLELWMPQITFKPRQDEDIDDLQAFLLELRGGKNKARIYDYFRTARNGIAQPRGAGAPTSTINFSADAAAGAETITLKNLTASQAVALKKMDHLGIGENLHTVLRSGPSDADGEGTFTIRPGLRMGAAENDPVNLVCPTGLFRLIGGDGDLAQHGTGHTYSAPLTLTFQEDPAYA